MRISAGLLLAASSAAAAAVVAPRHDASAAAAAAADVATPVVRRTQSGKGITLPISRKQADRTPSRVLEEARRQRQRIQNRYGSKQTSSPSASDSASKAEEKRGTVGIVDFGPDSFYFAQIAIGTPPQLLDISLDTGSSDFWVADSQCTSAACQGAIPFDEGASSSLVRSNTPWSIQYGKGSAAGLLAADTVSFAGYTVMNSTFALATEVDEVLNAPISGLMGLAWKSLSTTGATPFWQAVVEGGTVQDQVFSFQLARNNEAENLYTEEIPLNPGGVFTLGEIDENQFQGQITWHTVPDRYIQRAGYWAIELESVSVQGRSATTSGQYAVIDTGTTLIAGPPNLIAAFYDLIPNSQPIDGGFYVFPCDTTVELSFTFDGTTYDVDPRDFNFGAVGQGYCVGSLFEENLGSSAPQFIVGDTFLKNVYSAYRYNPPSVGFAKLKNGAAQVLSIPSGASKTASAIATASRSSTGATPTTVPGLVTQSTRVNSSPTGLSGGSGLPDPSVVSGTSPVTSLSFSTLPSSGAGSSGGGGSSAAAPSLVRAGGLLAAGSGALVAAFMAGAAVLLL
ncbi:unnamed protein product [Tilletia caries]|uniref:Peptidase A1 domain-containing protein n=1 Tax=Tilletia caries TaxID=13290 RepID=A0ABN7J4G1_9BASI|nr:hypothetical protein CF336_g1051 [Tilletia laevis]CAD6893788.1 unnamed protein product [Tilletia caries]CAD6951792.1 unnamed protein product [Tilletia caries]